MLYERTKLDNKHRTAQKKTQFPLARVCGVLNSPQGVTQANMYFFKRENKQHKHKNH